MDSSRTIERIGVMCTVTVNLHVSTNNSMSMTVAATITTQAISVGGKSRGQEVLLWFVAA